MQIVALEPEAQLFFVFWKGLIGIIRGKDFIVILEFFSAEQTHTALKMVIL